MPQIENYYIKHALTPDDKERAARFACKDSFLGLPPDQHQRYMVITEIAYELAKTLMCYTAHDQRLDSALRHLESCVAFAGISLDHEVKEE